MIEPHPDDRVALISRGRSTTYGTLRDQVAHLRGGLVGLGIEPGDRVAVVCANNWYFVASYLAALGVGAIAVPLNPLSPPRPAERLLRARRVVRPAAAARPGGGSSARRGTGVPPVVRPPHSLSAPAPIRSPRF